MASDPEVDDSWTMVFWDAEADRPLLYSYCTEVLQLGISGVSTWEWNGSHWKDIESSGTWGGPAVWVGPLGKPGGPFGTTIAEFDEETYREAKRLGQVMVMQHIDSTTSNDGLGTVTYVDVREDVMGG